MVTKSIARPSYGEDIVVPRPPSLWEFCPEAAQDYSLVTGLHQFYKVREQYVSIPLTEATDIIGDLEVEGDSVEDEKHRVSCVDVRAGGLFRAKRTGVMCS